VKFKAKVYSFADVVVRDNELTLYQITEPLTDMSTATAQIPAPFGTDFEGRPLMNPIPDTLVDPATGDVVSTPATGTPALLDKFTVTRPDVSDDVQLVVTGPELVRRDGTATFDARIENSSRIGLNGTQVVFALPDGATFAGTSSDTTTVQGNEVVVTLGRLDPRSHADVSIDLSVSSRHFGVLTVGATLRSSTAQSVLGRPAFAFIE
jgi:hypothetical protein